VKSIQKKGIEITRKARFGPAALLSNGYLVEKFPNSIVAMRVLREILRYPLAIEKIGNIHTKYLRKRAISLVDFTNWRIIINIGKTIPRKRYRYITADLAEALLLKNVDIQ